MVKFLIQLGRIVGKAYSSFVGGLLHIKTVSVHRLLHALLGGLILLPLLNLIDSGRRGKQPDEEKYYANLCCLVRVHNLLPVTFFVIKPQC